MVARRPGAFYTTTPTTGGQATVTKMMAVASRLARRSLPARRACSFKDYGAIGENSWLRRDARRSALSDGPAEGAGSGHASQMILVQNWLEELKARVPTK